jgi:rod shape-determining protein MreB
VYIEEEPKVAAVGAGLDISKPSGNMVVDIGGGTTDVAVLSLGDIVTSQSLKTAGDKMDAEIVKYVKDKYKLLIGDSTAEHVKMEIGCAYDGDPDKKVDVRGRDLVTGLPKTIQVSEAEVEEALHEICETILASAKQVLEQTPPELSADIVNKGVFLTGGGALLHNLDKFMEQGLKVPVFVADKPLDCVAEGCGVMLENTVFLD